MPCRWTPTATVRTGGGGVHLYFVRNADVHNSASSLPGVSFPLAGIDLRGVGGYVVAPPSRHRAGRRYVWLGADARASYDAGVSCGLDVLTPCTHCSHTYVRHRKGTLCLSPGCRCTLHACPDWRANWRR